MKEIVIGKYFLFVQLARIPVAKEDVSMCGWFRDQNNGVDDILFSWKEYRCSVL